ncbi:hypothetical protein C1Y40_05152 [Mycobacterium talmoniae]|uniref:DUF3558 domain-containing protein n=1 Tax=Mycobacterium talmoniae TaxID=1858794 RepID=A0A2S8BDH5_9MYCO|nr:hypothetical protein [Mycobacterium eburneum]PQM44693.1 hypothetical protein C1Y40_05152 [Mycobacterium talmoniae]TDH57739.1 hypothetical protein E2F47_00815 [Mycobacterium eburneum]
MLRAIGCAAALLMCGVLAVACHTPSPPAANTTSVQPAPPDQSTVFFPTTLDTYGLNLTQVDRNHLSELYALRQIDPCGFVDPQILTANNHKDFSYTYSAVSEIEEAPASVSPVAPLGGDACTIAFPSTQTGLSLQVLPGEPRLNDQWFSPDSSHPGLTTRTSPCMFRAALPLTGLAGAPKSMRDPVIEVDRVNITNGWLDFDDTSLCPLAEAIAADVAAHARQRGVAVHSADRGAVAAKFLTSDPCATAPDLHAVGFVWKEPNPEAQSPTTWRHPGVCNLEFANVNTDPDVLYAVVKHGLAAWSDAMITSNYLRPLGRSERDGVTLFDFTNSSDDGCGTFVIAKADVRIEPVRSGSGADLTAPTPVVIVKLGTPAGEDCAETARQAAFAAIKRAT